MTVLCVIGARGGSQGLPGKNTKVLLGKPLIAWTIEAALQTPEIDKVVVSTDSKKIGAIARDFGAETPFFRPDFLSGPEVGKFDVWKHALESCEKYYNEEYEIFIDLDCTNPLREVSDISNIIKQLRGSIVRGVDTVFTICEARKNPYFNMIVLDKNGLCKLPLNNETQIFRRQDTPKIFDLTTVCYVMSPKFILEKSHLFDGDLMMQHVPIERSVDIDTQLDFDIAEFLINRREYGV